VRSYLAEASAGASAAGAGEAAGCTPGLTRYLPASARERCESSGG